LDHKNRGVDEAPVRQEAKEYFRRYSVWYIADNFFPFSSMPRQKSGQIELENICFQDEDIVPAPGFFFQDGNQLRIDFHGQEILYPRRHEPGQDAVTGADFQHHVLPPQVRRSNDFPSHIVVL